MERKGIRLRSVWHKGLVEPYSSVTLRAVLSPQTITYRDANGSASCSPITLCFKFRIPRSTEEKNGSHYGDCLVVWRLDNYGNPQMGMRIRPKSSPHDGEVCEIQSTQFGYDCYTIHSIPFIPPIGFPSFSPSTLPFEVSTKAYDGSFPAGTNRRKL